MIFCGGFKNAFQSLTYCRSLCGMVWNNSFTISNASLSTNSLIIHLTQVATRGGPPRAVATPATLTAAVGTRGCQTGGARGRWTVVNTAPQDGPATPTTACGAARPPYRPPMRPGEERLSFKSICLCFFTNVFFNFERPLNMWWVNNLMWRGYWT